MQDIRIRIGSVILLVCAAFFSMYGAIAALIWWLVFTPRFQSIKRIRPFIALMAVIGLISIILQITNESGISYFVRMMAIILVSSWLATEYQSSEFLNFGVWLFGERVGFELGLLAEMSMQSLISLVNTLVRIQLAFRLKKEPIRLKTIIPAGILVTHIELSRAKENAELLAIRGYRYGGTLKPSFFSNRLDIIAGLCTIPIVLIPFLSS